MVILFGPVTDMEPASFVSKTTGELVETGNIWISTGRGSIKTTGPVGDLEKYKRGQTVIMRVEPRSFKDSSEVTAKRIEELTLEHFGDMVAEVVAGQPEGKKNGKD